MTREWVPPLAAACVTLALLCTWTAAGGAGRTRPIEAEDGRILIPATGSATAAFFTLRNPGDVPDELTGATCESSGSVVLKQHLHRGGAAGSWTAVTRLTVPARGQLRMAPEGADLLVTRPPALRAGQRVECTLHFRRSADLPLRAVAVAPGGLGSGPEVAGNSRALQSD